MKVPTIDLTTLVHCRNYGGMRSISTIYFLAATAVTHLEMNNDSPHFQIDRYEDCTLFVFFLISYVIY